MDDDKRVIVPGLSAGEQETLDRLWSNLRAKRTRNVLRDAYYDGKNALRRCELSAVPPSFLNIATVLGWPAKAVDTLNARCRLEGFAAPGVNLDDTAMPELWRTNALAAESSEVGVSALIHSVAFLVTTRGAAGEPAALITPRDARSGTGEYDGRLRRLTSFLSVADEDEHGNPLDWTLYTDVEIVTMTRERAGAGWAVDRQVNPLRRVPVEPVVFRPRVGRRFGSSRISRAVMSMTDLAMRTVLRSEVTGELYSVPQRILLGANPSDFTNPDGTPKSAWQTVFSRVWGLERDDDGEIPELHQLAQATQQPHMDQLRALAQLFAGETSIPVSSLGISTEANPASAEAYYASREDLISLAEDTTDRWARSWERSMASAMELAGDAPPPNLQARWRSVSLTSRAAAADATLKMLTGFPWMADSDAALELYGLDDLTVQRLLADKRRVQSRSVIASLAGGDQAAASDGDEDGPSLKERADALGALIRAGVDQESAAAQVGLSGLVFTGAVPVSLRLPEGAATAVEDR